MQENIDPPRAGRETLVVHERHVMAAFKSITAKKIGPAVIDGDRVGIRWRFAFEPFEGSPHGAVTKHAGRRGQSGIVALPSYSDSQST